MLSYEKFLNNLDQKLNYYFDLQKEYIYCQKGCSLCCKNGDYPLSQLELEYLMQGYITLDNSLKIIIQNNIKSMKKGSVCPFLVNNECSIYKYRPIICRVHGLAYLYKNNTVRVLNIEK